MRVAYSDHDLSSDFVGTLRYRSAGFLVTRPRPLEALSEGVGSRDYVALLRFATSLRFILVPAQVDASAPDSAT